MFVSSTESATARALGVSSTLPEQYGADFLFAAQSKWYGVQRKELKDFVVSVDDGRLATERLQMFSLHHAYLILETGERGGAAPREYPNGQLAALSSYGRPWTGAMVRGVLYGLRADGIQVITVKDETETLAAVKELEAWAKKPEHQSARSRGTVPTDVFGKRGVKEYGTWLLRSLPGVGAKTADAVWEKFGGLPFEMKPGIGVRELMSVDGVGKVTAQRIVDVFGGEA